MGYRNYKDVPIHDRHEKVLRLMKDKFRKRISVSEDLAFGDNIDLEAFIDISIRNLVADFKKEVLYYKQQDLKYPANWVEAFKERWFPAWLLKYYPVEYTLIEVREYYPRMAIPNSQDRYIRFKERRGYGI